MNSTLLTFQLRSDCPLHLTKFAATDFEQSLRGAAAVPDKFQPAKLVGCRYPTKFHFADFLPIL
jgi:hypothetical protein